MAPPVRIVIEYTPATGVTEVRFPAGGQQFASGILLDVVGQIVEKMEPQNAEKSGDVVKGVVSFLLNQANKIIETQLRPGKADVDRIHVVGG